MKCISCGKKIAFTAKICPYCQRDATASTNVHSGTILLALVGAGAGYLVNDFVGAMIGGALIGGLGGGQLFVRAQKKYGDQPSTVKLAHSASDLDNVLNSTTSDRDAAKPGSESAGPIRKATSVRLQELENLKASGLLTQSEYNSKRSQILSEL